jgi:hypothetical protein
MKDQFIRLKCDKALLARIDQYRREVAKKLNREPIRRADAVHWLVLVGLEAIDKNAGRILSRVKRRLRSPYGRSYERAWEYLTNIPADTDAFLVHGVVSGSIYHAWVEISDLIYDPVLTRLLPADTYAATMGGVVIEQRYSRAEAVQAAGVTGHAGPWHTAEDAMSKNDDNPQ